MKIKFTDIVKITRKTCGKNITLIFTVPCELDKSIMDFMSNFGKSKFDLDTIKFLHIATSDDYTIKGRLEKTSISFSVSKKSKNVSLFGTKQVDFENNIIRWIESKLGISIYR